MTTIWRSKGRERPPPAAETQRLLSTSPDMFDDECDQVHHSLTAYQTVRAHIVLDPPRLKVSAIDRLFKRFRSASMDTDKPIVGLGEDLTKSTPYSSTETFSKKDFASSSPKHHPSEAVWVTSASHPSPFSPPPTDAKGQPLPGSRTQGHSAGFLSDLSLHSTPLTSGTQPPPASKPEAASHKVLTAQELHDSMLSALGQPVTSPVKPGDKKIPKKQPTGTMEYTIKDGDTLVKIGAHFEVTPSELMRINKLVSRTVFVGQTLFVPDPNYVPSEPSTPKSGSPVPDTRPKMDIPLASLPTVPGHAVQVTPATTPGKSTTLRSQLSSQTSQVDDEPDKECLQKFLKMPVRRVLDEGECEDISGSEGFTVKGTLLVTPNAIMFDPNVNDPIVIDKDDQLKFSVVVYMEEIKSVALFHDISPRMFWKLPKEIRARSPKPETYRSGQGKRPKVEGHAETQAELGSTPSPVSLGPVRETPDGASIGGDSSQRRMSPDGGDTVTGRTSEELENITDISANISDLTVQPGRASEEVEHALISSQGFIPASPVIKQMSRSSELEVCEISQLRDAAENFGETRDFGSHMGRSSSEVHRQTSSALGRISDASPGDMGGHSFFQDRCDSTSDNLNTPTQGFAPVHFTDRSPMTVTTHPKPVPGQRLMLLSQSPVTDLKSEQNRITEDSEISAADSSLSGQSDTSTAPGGQRLSGDHSSLSDFSSTRNSAQGDAETGQTSTSQAAPGVDVATISHSADSTAAFSVGEVSASGQDASLTASTNISDTHSAGNKTYPEFYLGNSHDKRDESDDDSTQPTDDSSRLPFSPLRTPAQHISSFLNYTSSFFRSTSTDKDDSSSGIPSTSDGKGKYSSVPSTGPYQLQLKTEFTKADITRALGPDPKEYLPRSDSHHFEESPLYLQIRPGVQMGKEVFQPRAFDHRNVSPLLEEYWFVVPRDMGDKLYNFLMEWQPDAYGNEEETKPREKFFYDVRKVESGTNLVAMSHAALTSKAAGDAPDGKFLSSDDHFNEAEKTWEILSKEEVYRAEQEQAINRDEAFDESNLPELIGPTVIIKDEYVRAVMKSLPRNMSVGYNWELVYGTHKHGYSLHNLYMRTEEVENDSPVLLFIMDTYGSVFGAFLSNNIRPNDTFYGSGATFLFTFYPTFRKYPWMGCNQFFMHGTKEFFAVGSGEGCFGLWLDGDLNKGRSRQCATFHNDVLSREEDFSILQLEVWRFVDSSLL